MLRPYNKLRFSQCGEPAAVACKRQGVSHELDRVEPYDAKKLSVAPAVGHGVSLKESLEQFHESLLRAPDMRKARARFRTLLIDTLVDLCFREFADRQQQISQQNALNLLLIDVIASRLQIKPSNFADYIRRGIDCALQSPRALAGESTERLLTYFHSSNLKLGAIGFSESERSALLRTVVYELRARLDTAQTFLKICENYDAYFPANLEALCSRMRKRCGFILSQTLSGILRSLQFKKYCIRARAFRTTLGVEALLTKAIELLVSAAKMQLGQEPGCRRAVRALFREALRGAAERAAPANCAAEQRSALPDAAAQLAVAVPRDAVASIGARADADTDVYEAARRKNFVSAFISLYGSDCNKFLYVMLFSICNALRQNVLDGEFLVSDFVLSRALLQQFSMVFEVGESTLFAKCEDLSAALHRGPMQIDSSLVMVISRNSWTGAAESEVDEEDAMTENESRSELSADTEEMDNCLHTVLQNYVRREARDAEVQKQPPGSCASAAESPPGEAGGAHSMLPLLAPFLTQFEQENRHKTFVLCNKFSSVKLCLSDPAAAGKQRTIFATALEAELLLRLNSGAREVGAVRERMLQLGFSQCALEQVLKRLLESGLLVQRESAYEIVI